MKTIYLLQPVNFRVDYEINPWMDGNIDKVDTILAVDQWSNLAETLDNIGAKVVTFANDWVDGPDAVFIANAGLIHNDRFTIAAFTHEQRQVEETGWRNLLAAAEYKVLQHTDNGYFVHSKSPWEGAGDSLFGADKKTLFTGVGTRSSGASATLLAAHFDFLYDGNITTIPLTLVDNRFYHLDTCFCPLDNGYALAYPQAFTIESQKLLFEYYGDKMIWVDEDNAKKFMCNAVSVGDSIVTPKGMTPVLKESLQKLGMSIYEVDVSEFMKAGGGPKCLTLEKYEL